MKLLTIGLAALLASGQVAIAYATPSVNNGDFGSAKTAPTQFGGSTRSGHDGNGSCTFGGQFVTGWTGNGGYEIWYPSASAASSVTSCNQYNGSTTQRLPSGVVAPPFGPGTFVGLDGQHGIQGGIGQMINGLTPGGKYTVSFYWATTQEMSFTGATWDYLQVSLGSESHDTTTNHIGTHGWSGWSLASLTFTADSASEFLNFLSFGGQEGKSFEDSAGLPPFALLTGVSITRNVPEPPELALFGGGLLGLGLLTVLARRRALRRGVATGDDNLV
ncbi:MAG TPA: hypothetical protein VFJ87_04650 [Rhodanobacteraceae bacterium]|nr:hypothetical protein [Rhodanobacteraceae bacterium]